jgi:hypothetical protein
MPFIDFNYALLAYGLYMVNIILKRPAIEKIEAKIRFVYILL